MHQAAENVIRQRMERTAQALRKNNMEAICVDARALFCRLVFVQRQRHYRQR